MADALSMKEAVEKSFALLKRVIPYCFRRVVQVSTCSKATRTRGRQFKEQVSSLIVKLRV
jgi:hypothetical protein